MRAIQHQLLPDAPSVYKHLTKAGPIKSFRPLGQHCTHISGQIQLNGVILHSHCGSESEFVVEPSRQMSLVAIVSGSIAVADPMGEGLANAGDGLLLPSGSGERSCTCTTAVSNMSLFIDPAAIRKTAAAIAGDPPEDRAYTDQPWLLAPQLLEPRQASALFSLLRHLDACLSVDPRLPLRLGLDDLILRQVACWLRPELLTGPLPQASPCRDRRSHAAFDELLDDIRAHLDQPLRLSDLEARSFYSRRALHYAFRDKLNTTPVQWIREQRLTRAFAKLQEEGPAASIRAVALACGYRQTSQFSTDFKNRFGLSPSQVRQR